MPNNSQDISRDLDPSLSSAVESLRQVFQEDLPEQKFIFPNLIPYGGNVIIGVGSGIDPSIWSSLIVYGSTTGRGLTPLGKADVSPALNVAKPSSRLRAFRDMKLILEKDSSLEYRDLAADNMFFFRGEMSGYGAGYLNDISNLSSIESELPSGCKVVFFYDGEFALSRTKISGTKGDRPFCDHVRKLNEAGIATMIFHRTGKSGAEPLIDQLLPDGANYFVDLVANPEAPREFGSGFNVHRKKTSEFDTAPTCFQFWHTVIEGKLSFGWEMPDQSVPKTKEIEIIERQIRVKQLLDAGMAQKDAASVLNVHASTICRDASKVKGKKKRPKAGNSVSDDASDRL